MSSQPIHDPDHRLIRFGTFEADPATGELRKAGQKIRLQDQPFRILLLLLENPGEVVSRAELRMKIWGETYVDFEEGLNTAVRKLRDALGDSATNPRFIETLPRRGYRFIAPTELVGGVPASPQTKESQRPRWLWFAGVVAVASLAFVLALRTGRQPHITADPLRQLTRDSGLTTEPAISQDGKFVVYASDRAGEGNLDIWVQHISGGEPVRLTSDPANEHQPEISPDGSRVLFRSEGKSPGIYTIPTLGGAPSLIVREGYLPRYSPDASQIAFIRGASGSGAVGGELHVYTPGSGATRMLAPGVFVTGPPTWSPDGEYVAFAGAKNLKLSPLDLLICSVQTGALAKMAARPILENIDSFGTVGMVTVAWSGDQIIVSLKRGDSANLWAGRVPRGKHELAGELKRLTVGSGNETMPSVSAAGRLVFVSHSYSAGIWEALVQKNAAPEMRRVTQDRAMNLRPSVSLDGAKLAYISDRAGSLDVWLRDLIDGKEAPLTRSDKSAVFAALSRDGRQVAFWVGAGIYFLSTTDGTPRLICEDCGRPDGWTPDGKVITSPRPDNNPIQLIGLRDPLTAAYTKLLGHPTLHTTAPDLSRDGKWLTFHTSENIDWNAGLRNRRQIFVAPYRGQWTPRESWIPVTDGTGLDREAKWSPDGNRIYFLSDRDGFRCIWARDLDPKNKKPLESIYPVVHLHDSRLSLSHIPNSGNVSICPVGDKLIFAMGELTGNIWMTDLHPN